MLNSLRFIICCDPACRQMFFLCSRCDRGHQYCSSLCRQKARRLSVREAKRRHQRSPEGRLDHSEAQRRYRQRRNSVMDHSPKNLPRPIFLCLPLHRDRSKKEADDVDLDSHTPRQETHSNHCNVGDKSDLAKGKLGDESQSPTSTTHAIGSVGSMAGDEGPRCAGCGRAGKYLRQPALLLRRVYPMVDFATALLGHGVDRFDTVGQP